LCATIGILALTVTPAIRADETRLNEQLYNQARLRDAPQKAAPPKEATPKNKTIAGERLNQTPPKQAPPKQAAPRQAAPRQAAPRQAAPRQAAQETVVQKTAVQKTAAPKTAVQNASSSETPLMPLDEEHTIESTTYNGRPAYRLSDGRSEAVIVPELGRVMRFGFPGGPNWLWNSPTPVITYGGWKNWGGDKTWPGPERDWAQWYGAGWPPPQDWDATPHQATELPGARLRTTSEISKFTGTRVVREYGFNKDDFVVSQTIEKVQGPPLKMSVWGITQLGPMDAIYLPLNPNSAYKNNWVWQTKPAPEARLSNIAADLLEIRPTSGKNYKVGADSLNTTILAVKGDVALRLRTPRAEGEYPDGAPFYGTPIEVYVNGDKKAPYAELEMLSPIRTFTAGISWTQTVRWSLHPLPTKAAPASTIAAIRALLQPDKRS
jgi:hypothetical protein